uniref:uncharacterized protein LOC100175079 isoform X2 n=1 Tax=Ciona intestinalis TaxID=7719 RepID=UPI00089DAC68|nr:uncharacterized protein LOC100175079 isoform X2 [Ciona intestinalis]|eukprot:XP_018667905.1 uncharacterized protein LOC100175079 isoform X2 [Ciona intestinalis]
MSRKVECSFVDYKALQLPCYKNDEVWMCPTVFLRQILFPNQVLKKLEDAVTKILKSSKNMTKNEVKSLREWLEYDCQQNTLSKIRIASLDVSSLSFSTTEMKEKYKTIVDEISRHSALNNVEAKRETTFQTNSNVSGKSDVQISCVETKVVTEHNNKHDSTGEDNLKTGLNIEREAATPQKDFISVIDETNLMEEGQRFCLQAKDTKVSRIESNPKPCKPAPNKTLGEEFVNGYQLNQADEPTPQKTFPPNTCSNISNTSSCFSHVLQEFESERKTLNVKCNPIKASRNKSPSSPVVISRKMKTTYNKHSSENNKIVASPVFPNRTLTSRSSKTKYSSWSNRHHWSRSNNWKLRSVLNESCTSQRVEEKLDKVKSVHKYAKPHASKFESNTSKEATSLNITAVTHDEYAKTVRYVCRVRASNIVKSFSNNEKIQAESSASGDENNLKSKESDLREFISSIKPKNQDRTNTTVNHFTDMVVLDEDWNESADDSNSLPTSDNDIDKQVGHTRINSKRSKLWPFSFDYQVLNDNPFSNFSFDNLLNKSSAFEKDKIPSPNVPSNSSQESINIPLVNIPENSTSSAPGITDTHTPKSSSIKAWKKIMLEKAKENEIKGDTFQPGNAILQNATTTTNKDCGLKIAPAVVSRSNAHDEQDCNEKFAVPALKQPAILVVKLNPDGMKTTHTKKAQIKMPTVKTPAAYQKCKSNIRKRNQHTTKLKISTGTSIRKNTARLKQRCIRRKQPVASKNRLNSLRRAVRKNKPQYDLDVIPTAEQEDEIQNKQTVETKCAEIHEKNKMVSKTIQKCTKKTTPLSKKRKPLPSISTDEDESEPKTFGEISLSTCGESDDDTNIISCETLFKSSVEAVSVERVSRVNLFDKSIKETSLGEECCYKENQTSADGIGNFDMNGGTCNELLKSTCLNDEVTVTLHASPMLNSHQNIARMEAENEISTTNICASDTKINTAEIVTTTGFDQKFSECETEATLKSFGATNTTDITKKGETAYSFTLFGDSIKLAAVPKATKTPGVNDFNNIDPQPHFTSAKDQSENAKQSWAAHNHNKSHSENLSPNLSDLSGTNASKVCNTKNYGHFHLINESFQTTAAKFGSDTSSNKSLQEKRNAEKTVASACCIEHESLQTKDEGIESDLDSIQEKENITDESNEATITSNIDSSLNKKGYVAHGVYETKTMTLEDKLSTTNQCSKDSGCFSPFQKITYDSDSTISTHEEYHEEFYFENRNEMKNGSPPPLPLSFSQAQPTNNDNRTIVADAPRSAQHEITHHGILEIGMQAPSYQLLCEEVIANTRPISFIRRRIPYIQIKLRRTDNGNNHPDMVPPNSNVGQGGETTPGFDVTLVRIRDVAFTLKTSPTDIMVDIVSRGIKSYPPNTFARNVYQRIFDKQAKEMPVIQAMLCYTALLAGIVDPADNMILLDDYLRVILPHFYLASFGIEKELLPHFVSVKTYKPIDYLDPHVIEMFCKTFSYNGTLVSMDVDVKSAAYRYFDGTKERSAMRRKRKSSDHRLIKQPRLSMPHQITKQPELIFNQVPLVHNQNQVSLAIQNSNVSNVMFQPRTDTSMFSQTSTFASQALNNHNPAAEKLKWILNANDTSQLPLSYISRQRSSSTNPPFALPSQHSHLAPHTVYSSLQPRQVAPMPRSEQLSTNIRSQISVLPDVIMSQSHRIETAQLVVPAQTRPVQSILNPHLCKDYQKCVPHLSNTLLSNEAPINLSMGAKFVNATLNNSIEQESANSTYQERSLKLKKQHFRPLESIHSSSMKELGSLIPQPLPLTNHNENWNNNIGNSVASKELTKTSVVPKHGTDNSDRGANYALGHELNPIRVADPSMPPCLLPGVKIHNGPVVFIQHPDGTKSVIKLHEPELKINAVYSLSENCENSKTSEFEDKTTVPPRQSDIPNPFNEGSTSNHSMILSTKQTVKIEPSEEEALNLSSRKMGNNKCL